jgi:hypothetical protein
MTTIKKLLRRNAAALYLAEVWGVCRTPGSLKTIASAGEGPDFVHVGGVVYYRPEDLDAWVKATTAPHKRLTSKRAKRAKRTTKMRATDDEAVL